MKKNPRVNPKSRYVGIRLPFDLWLAVEKSKGKDRTISRAIVLLLRERLLVPERMSGK